MNDKASELLRNTGQQDLFKKKVLFDSVRHFCEPGRGYDFGHDIIPLLIHSARTYAYDFRHSANDLPRYRA